MEERRGRQLGDSARSHYDEGSFALLSGSAKEVNPIIFTKLAHVGIGKEGGPNIDGVRSEFASH